VEVSQCAPITAISTSQDPTVFSMVLTKFSPRSMLDAINAQAEDHTVILTPVY
jgi:hypothetical protein